MVVTLSPGQQNKALTADLSFWSNRRGWYKLILYACGPLQVASLSIMYRIGCYSSVVSSWSNSVYQDKYRYSILKRFITDRFQIITQIQNFVTCPIRCCITPIPEIELWIDKESFHKSAGQKSKPFLLLLSVFMRRIPYFLSLFLDSRFSTLCSFNNTVSNSVDIWDWIKIDIIFTNSELISWVSSFKECLRHHLSNYEFRMRWIRLVACMGM
jgi:hypothetical protein